MERNDSTPVQMRFRPQTLDRIDNLKEITGIENRTQIVSSSVALAEEIVTSIQEGAKVYIENPDGTRERITLVGF